jgi:hypothetical protein
MDFPEPPIGSGSWPLAWVVMGTDPGQAATPGPVTRHSELSESNIENFMSESSPTTKNVNVKQSNAAQDARNTRLKNTVELRKIRTEDRVKRLRNIEDDEETLPSVSYANGPSVSVVPVLDCEPLYFCFLTSML